MRRLVTPPRVTREYETIFILRQDVLDDERSKVLERVNSIVEKLEGHILQEDEWGKRRLAYRIRKNTHGFYYYYRLLGYNDLILELERNLRILEPVLKFLTVKLAEVDEREARIAEFEAEAAAEAQRKANEEAARAAAEAAADEDDDEDDDEEDDD